MSIENPAPEPVQAEQSDGATIPPEADNPNDSAPSQPILSPANTPADLIPQRERAARLAELTDPASPLYHVYLADYFGASPNVIAYSPDRFAQRFLWDRYQDALKKDQAGEPMTPYQSRMIGQEAQAGTDQVQRDPDASSAPSPRDNASHAPDGETSSGENIPSAQHADSNAARTVEAAMPNNGPDKAVMVPVRYTGMPLDKRPNYDGKNGVGANYEAINKLRYNDKNELDSSDIALFVGGQLEKEHDSNHLGAPKGKVNTCAIRISYALNEGGDPIDPETAKRANIRLYQGRDGKYYIVGVKELKKYLEEKYGRPTDSGTNSQHTGDEADGNGGVMGLRDRIAGKKGIFVYLGKMDGAEGHMTTWNGNKIVQEGNDYSNKPGMKAYFWQLPDNSTTSAQDQ